jgi:DNA-binding LytR/AlgR family response regulator
MAGHDTDLVFLDVNMPDLTGIQFLDALQKRPLVVFTTAYSEYGVRSYDYDAVDYLLKPIEFERFLRAVNKAQERRAREERTEGARGTNGSPGSASGAAHILVKSGSDYYRLELDDIRYVEAAGNYAVFVTQTASVMSLMSLKEVCAHLPSARFVRVHKSYVVNCRHLSRIERDTVRCADKVIPIGDAYRESFLKALQVP